MLARAARTATQVSARGLHASAAAQTAASAGAYPLAFRLGSSPSSRKIPALATAALSQDGKRQKGALVTDRCSDRFRQLVSTTTVTITAKLDGTGCYIGPLTADVAAFIASRSGGRLEVGRSGSESVLTVTTARGSTHRLTVGDVHAFRRQDVKLNKRRRKQKQTPAAAKGTSGAAAPETGNPDEIELKPGWFPTSAPSWESGHWVGFLPIFADEPEKHFVQAMDPTERVCRLMAPDGSSVGTVGFGRFGGGMTVELLGPKVNGNRHALDQHCIAIHGEYDIGAAPELSSLTAPVAGRFDIGAVRGFLARNQQFEGLVAWCAVGGDFEYFKLHRGHLGLPDGWGGTLA